MSGFSLNALRKKFFIITILVIVSLINFWTYSSSQNDFSLTIALIIETFLVYLSFFLKSKLIGTISFFMLIFLGLFLIKNYFDFSLFKTTPIESVQLIKNHEYYGNELGKLYKNRFGIFYFLEFQPQFYKLEGKLFRSLDFRAYFGIERGKDGYYPLIFFPFFIIGFLHLLTKAKLNFTYLLIAALLISIFIHTENNSGSVLLFPFLNIGISLGIIKSILFIKHLPFNYE